MSEKKKETINPYQVLGVCDERANELSEELQTLIHEANNNEGVLTAIAERYAPESIVMGMYLAVYLMEQEGRLLPLGATIVGTGALPLPDYDPSLC